MLNTFLRFIKEESLFAAGDTVLLAVSGGLDSAVMTDLFFRAGIAAVVAHCNFGLRGEESEADEAFVRQLASQYSMAFYSKRFDTSEYAAQKRISIQEAARELRYQWFSNLVESERLSCCATAHHLDDSVETVLLNLARGTGISGLHGIPVKNKGVIRPLLFAARAEIQDYAIQNRITYREDSSNASDKYSRNKIRNRVVPVLKEINPSLEYTMQQTIRNVKDAEQIVQEYIQEKKKDICMEADSCIRMSIAALQQAKGTRTVLFELLNPYGFNTDVVQDIYEVMGKESGRQFYSSTHKLVADRSELILYPIPLADGAEYRINRDGPLDTLPFELDITFESRDQLASFPTEKNTGLFDSDLLIFPLVLRKWRTGDFFYPLGMEKRKKLSDFFIDGKFSLHQKEEAWILVSGGDIIWIAGHRIDNRYKVSEHTRNICRVNCKI